MLYTEWKYKDDVLARDKGIERSQFLETTATSTKLLKVQTTGIVRDKMFKF